MSIRAMESLREHTTVPYQLIVVDNASPAHKAEQGMPVGPYKEFLREICFHQNVDYLKQDTNIGFGRAVNLAIPVAKGEYFCQMNSDCELVEDTLVMLIGALEYYHFDVAMPEHFENCKAYNLGKSRELMTEQWRFGAFWLMRKQMFESVMGFDESFDMCYYEDTDLWRRIEARGGRIHGYRGTWVKHKGGASSLPNRDALFMANKKRFEDKWGVAK